MHEAALAAPLLRLVLEEAGRRPEPGLRVERVLVRAGLLLGVEPAQLAGVFALMAEGTPAEGAALIVETEPLRGRCRVCGAEAALRVRRFACPECASPEVDWRNGRELYIASITVSAADSPPRPAENQQEATQP